MAPISPNRMNRKARNFSGPHEETVGGALKRREMMETDGANAVTRVTFLRSNKNQSACLHICMNFRSRHRRFKYEDILRTSIQFRFTSDADDLAPLFVISFSDISRFFFPFLINPLFL